MSFDLPTITTADLVAQEGKTVPQFCNCGYVDMHQNHCAHFVSHVLDIEVGLLCGSMAWATRGRGVSLRVNQVFNSLTTRGRWDDASQLPAAVANCNAFLLFATSRIDFIQQLGIGTAVAVGVDAVVVRAILVPSLMMLLGSANWWAPRPLRSLHRRLRLAH